VSAGLRAVTAAVALGALGCASSGGVPGKTQLELREFQTRTFETADPKLALRAAINTMLDDGFLIDSADAELGLLTATQKTSTRSFMGNVTMLMTYGMVKPWRLSVLEATVKVDEFGGGARVRVSFQLTEEGLTRSSAKAKPVLDPAFYQAFFSRLDKSVFLLKEKL
jgi:hypothetical protein